MPRNRLTLDVAAQPDETTCGPTCLEAVYRYFGDPVPLARIVDEVRTLDEGGTLEVFLACHALERGYRATIHTCNLTLFDPTWFADGADLRERLAEQARHKHSSRIRQATAGYLRYIDLGGRLLLGDLTGGLLRGYLRRDIPVLCGLSATWLYGSMRERPLDCREDDILGEPVGHFVALSGYDRERRAIRVADPYHRDPTTDDGQYEVTLDRLVGAIYLGIVSFDANLLIIEPPK